MKTAIIVAAIALSGAVPAFAGHHESMGQGAAMADGHSQMLMAGLLGSNEVPAGDTDGRGQFMAWPNAEGQLCYRLMVTNVATATMAHIHAGKAGVNGPVIVPLTTPAGGKSEGCVALPAATLGAMTATPGDFYINVHNAEFPGGAVRGQLMSHGM
ncbi:CHRD domain-containing protein [Croceicoccus bisphenolivorans]|uniref:CHRD domain-containing protein n=1 Tax=Croceicoccus bisphenolivorans TaxID=1783232 RepID=UPI0009EEA3D9|nr:CHRD domain-containing protein [Croceicoccus bisphenolivorans]